MKTILVSLDGSELAELALPYAVELAKQSSIQAIEILLLNVCKPEIIPKAAYKSQPDYPPDAPVEYEDYVKQEIARVSNTNLQYLEKTARKIRLSGTKVRDRSFVRQRS